MALLVVEVTDGLPGWPGTPGGAEEVGGVPPPQFAPLTVQFVGEPLPLALKPKVVDAPGASVPFHPTLFAVTCWPEVVIAASQNTPMVVPAGRSNWTFQLLIEDEVLLVTVNLPSYPLDQLETLTKVAVAAFAAGDATNAIADASNATLSVAKPTRKDLLMAVESPLGVRSAGDGYSKHVARRRLGVRLHSLMSLNAQYVKEG